MHDFPLVVRLKEELAGLSTSSLENVKSDLRILESAHLSLNVLAYVFFLFFELLKHICNQLLLLFLQVSLFKIVLVLLNRFYLLFAQVFYFYD